MKDYRKCRLRYSGSNSNDHYVKSAQNILVNHSITRQGIHLILVLTAAYSVIFFNYFKQKKIFHQKCHFRHSCIMPTIKLLPISCPLEFSCGPAIPTVPPTTNTPQPIQTSSTGDYSTRESTWTHDRATPLHTTGKKCIMVQWVSATGK